MELLIKGSIELNKMFMALQRTATGLRHDFGEVENLQQSLRGARDFVKKAAARIEESILSDLLLVRPSAGLLTPNVSHAGDGRDEFVLALSGASNFVRANPHFAISLALRSGDETKIALVYSPIDERLYYAESGRGSYVFSAYHSARTRVSNLSDAADLTIAYNTSDNRQMIGDARRTGCSALDLAWVASGKFDAFVSDPLDFAEIAAGDLLVREAGGKITMDVDLVATNGKIEL
ncbi:MAG: inositol monophosphatase [Proteobacteria bacterium]|uniref:Inositol monophosphatase n=1 Tax=Candidatus Enterousia avistercoris TaxID=2840788 RepID=A0A9D9DCD5_9PROT|nr:inositol monophosphatase [Candidatus Enterousia avistercoris]